MYSLSVLIFPKFRVNEVEKITVVFTRCEATFFFGGGGGWGCAGALING